MTLAILLEEAHRTISFVAASVQGISAFAHNNLFLQTQLPDKFVKTLLKLVKFTLRRELSTECKYEVVTIIVMPLGCLAFRCSKIVTTAEEHINMTLAVLLEEAHRTISFVAASVQGLLVSHQ